MWRLTVTTSWLAPVSSTIGWPMIGPLLVGALRAGRAVLRVAREADLGRARGRRGGDRRVHRRRRAERLGDRHRLLVVARVDDELLAGAEPEPAGIASRRPVAPTAVAPLSVVRSALSACWSITVARSANEVVTTNVFVYLSVWPAVSWSAAVVRVLADREPVERERLRDHERAVERHPPDRGAAGAVGDGVGRVAQARIGPQRRQRLRLQDLAVDDLRQVDLGAGEVGLRRAALVSVTFGAGAAGGGSTMLAIFTVSAFGP